MDLGTSMSPVLSATILAPVLIIVAASVSSSPTFPKELWHLNPHLMHKYLLVALHQ